MEFLGWVKEVNTDITECTLRQYSSYASRLEGVVLSRREDVVRAFSVMGGLNERSYEAHLDEQTFKERWREAVELLKEIGKAVPEVAGLIRDLQT